MKSPFRLGDVINGISSVANGLYIIVAFILIIAALVSLYEAGLLTIQMIMNRDYAMGRDVLIALFHGITAIVLIETTIVFFRTKHLAVQTLLIAGLTETIRHILAYDIMTMESMHIFAIMGIMAVLIAGIVLTKSDFEGQKTGTA